MPYDIFWIATICGGVLAALVIFDATMRFGIWLERWWDRR